MTLFQLAGLAGQHLIDVLRPQRRWLAERRRAWGRPGDKGAWRAEATFHWTRTGVPDREVDDKTWTDLELPALFRQMDTTITPLGSQALYRRLRTYEDQVDALERRHAGHRGLRDDPARRESLQRILSSLQDDDFAELADFLYGPPPVGITHPRLLWAWSLLCLIAFAGALLSWLPAWIPLLALAVNAVVIFRSAWRLGRESLRLKQVMAVLRTADALANVATGDPACDALARLRERSDARRRARRAIGKVSVLQGVVLQYVAPWLNLAFLAEWLTHDHVLRRFADFKAELQASHQLVGEVDAAIAVASYLVYRPAHCTPRVVAEANITLVAGCHPLLEAPVANDVCLAGRSALITGSNMAGKTTLVKLVGLNLILGRTLGFCLASQATLPASPVMASIRNEHSVASGKSNYFAEVEAIQRFLELAATGSCRVFIIDEPFSGTNTAERIAIARATLERLGRDAQVLVTTHDVELQHHLGDSHDLYHFQENPDIAGYFDYRMAPGAATDRNAIRLLARIGFPEPVLARAASYVADAASDQPRPRE